MCVSTLRLSFDQLFEVLPVLCKKEMAVSTDRQADSRRELAGPEAAA